MSSARPTPLSSHTYAATPDSRQAGASAIDADRTALTREYAALRLQLVELHSDGEPDMAAIDDAIEKLAQLQSDIKATHGLVGNNPIED